ncbi:MAG: RNA polymerase factor sigma-32 [Oligoflexia bacterium]
MPRKAKKAPRATSKALTPQVVGKVAGPFHSDVVTSDVVNSDDDDSEVIEILEPEPGESGEPENLPALPETQIATSLSDPLRRYLEETRRYPLLSPEEERQLALKMRDQGDMNAARALVQANLRLVVKIAMEYQSIYTNLLDLVQEGNIGLMKAVSKFDPSRNARLGYYASWWIRSYILKYLLDNFRLVKIGTTQAQKKLFYHLMREKQRLEAQGLFAGPKLLAEKLDVREKDVVEMEQRLSGGGAELSIDQPLSAGSEDSPRRSLKDLLADPSLSRDEVLAEEEWLGILKKKLPAFRKSLNPKEIRLLEDRLLAEEPKTLQEIADRYGLTRERARQIEAKLIEKLREFLKEYLT